VTDQTRPVVGRPTTKRTLDAILRAPEAELVAVYGRRRVGKTYLVREYVGPRADLFFSVTGEKDANLRVQLGHFQRELSRVFYDGAPLPRLRSWREAFLLMADVVDNYARANPSSTIVLFFDELPWMATRRSGLIPALDHVWNTRLVTIRGLRMVLCGSAASWMLEKLVHAEGGLHNRITRRIRLEPFSLGETRAYLHSRGIRWNAAQTIELYMAFGGVPYYLRQVQRGWSAAQNVAAACFDREGVLSDEFGRLFASLFEDAAAHEALVRAIASKRKGCGRDELIKATGTTSGGGLKRRLQELCEAGFVASFTPYGRKRRDTAYRLVDEFSFFFLKWMQDAPRGLLAQAGTDYWLGQRGSPAYNAWAGYAFEAVCLKHIRQIQRALDIPAGVATRVGTWRHVPGARSPRREGAQIDLLFDRDDGVVTVCEIKHSPEPYVLTKAYARSLAERIDVFTKRTRTKKRVSLALITVAGMKPNLWSEDLVDTVVTADALFDDAAPAR